MKKGSEYRLAPPLTVIEEQSTIRDKALGESSYELIAPPTRSSDTLILPKIGVGHARTWSEHVERNEDLRLRNRVETL